MFLLYYFYYYINKHNFLNVEIMVNLDVIETKQKRIDKE